MKNWQIPLEDNIEKMIKEGCGQGEGKDYKPWLTVQSFPSKGRSSRPCGIKTGRKHDFLSDQELNFFCILEYSDLVIDIREQYPLLHVEETIDIADEAGIDHPRNRTTGKLVVLTTDFLITVKRENSIKYLARAVKLSKDLSKKRVIEKLEIERRYCARKNIDWDVVTLDKQQTILAKNIDDILPYHTLHNRIQEIPPHQLADLTKDLKYKLEGNVVVGQIVREYDIKMHLERGTSLSIFKHLLATKQMSMDLQKRMSLDTPQQIIISKDVPVHAIREHGFSV